MGDIDTEKAALADRVSVLEKTLEQESEKRRAAREKNIKLKAANEQLEARVAGLQAELRELSSVDKT